MPLGTASERYARIRKGAGNLDSSDLPDADIDKYFTVWDDWGFTETGRTDWVSTDKNYNTLVLAIDYMIIAEVISGIPNKTAQDVEEAENLRRASRDMIRSINKKGEDQGVSNKSVFVHM